MRRFFTFIVPISALLLTGCANSGSVASRNPVAGPLNSAANQTGVQQASLPAVPQNPLNASDLAHFVDSQALAQFSEKERNEALSAQFYALQYGRPGAPRIWQGDRGAMGEVKVGPYVRVNNLDCRDFSHSVTVSGKTFAREGTACRERDGDWGVVEV